MLIRLLSCLLLILGRRSRPVAAHRVRHRQAPHLPQLQAHRSPARHQFRVHRHRPARVLRVRARVAAPVPVPALQRRAVRVHPAHVAARRVHRAAQAPQAPAEAALQVRYQRHLLPAVAHQARRVPRAVQAVPQAHQVAARPVRVGAAPPDRYRLHPLPAAARQAHPVVAHQARRVRVPPVARQAGAALQDQCLRHPCQVRPVQSRKAAVRVILSQPVPTLANKGVNRYETDR